MPNGAVRLIYSGIFVSSSFHIFIICKTKLSQNGLNFEGWFSDSNVPMPLSSNIVGVFRINKILIFEMFSK